MCHTMPVKLLKKAEKVFHEGPSMSNVSSQEVGLFDLKHYQVLYHGVKLILTHQIRNFEMIYLSSLLVLHHGLTELQ